MHRRQLLPEGDWMNWLPPSPHWEAILDFLERARCTLIERGEDESPLIQFEDGGLMELDKIRYDEDIAFYHADQPDGRVYGEYRATQYSDTCGSVDEMKRIFAEEPQRLAEDRDYLESLLKDALYMMRRMNRRQRACSEFGRQLAELVRQIQQVEEESMAPAHKGAEELRRMWDTNPDCAATELARLNELAEQVRGVGSRQENRLRDHKHLALEVFRAYQTIKGQRNWSEEEAQATSRVESGNDRAVSSSA